MRKILLLYVKPHVQEDPLAMVLGITYLGACLEREGIPVELCDERIVDDAYVKQAIERNDIIGCSSLTPNVRRSIAWAKYAKEKGKITLMGGPHASVDPGLFLDSGYFDYVLKGEAEFTLPQSLKALDGGKEEEIAAVPGIAFNRDGDRVDNPAPPLIKKLDEIPFPRGISSPKTATSNSTRSGSPTSSRRAAAPISASSVRRSSRGAATAFARRKTSSRSSKGSSRPTTRIGALHRRDLFVAKEAHPRDCAKRSSTAG